MGSDLHDGLSNLCGIVPAVVQLSLHVKLTAITPSSDLSCLAEVAACTELTCPEVRGPSNKLTDTPRFVVEAGVEVAK